MLKAFFEKAPSDTSYLFSNFKIWSAGEKYRAEQGKYPVIYLTFKDHKGRTWESAVSFLRDTLAAEVGRHACVLSDVWEVEANRKAMERVLAKESTLDELAASLGVLAEALHRHYGEKAVVLIDEYDSPVISAATKSIIPGAFSIISRMTAIRSRIGSTQVRTISSPRSSATCRTTRRRRWSRSCGADGLVCR